MTTAMTGCAEQDPTVKNPEVAVVKIATPSDAAGRGVLVSPDGSIVTCLHVIPSGAKITVIRADGQKLSADLVQTDTDTDLAILKVHGEKLPYLKFYDEDVTPGMHVRILGTAGVMQTTFEQWESFGKEIGFTARILPIDIGAPVLSDDGRVVAIVRGPIDGQPSHYSAIPAWHVGKMTPSLGQKSWLPGKSEN